ncbi:class I SAM-dependent methyltransferase [Pleionea litopenaei]|uniref:Methyltransferase n=1 Tax=Pleionea litopenaei TaxID=3070815 RepID=A0AA51X7V1_9GAMM|nr:methyltransferase [Pleionea sp. HL-JVS1]WMS88256.1 methyltransferase [Pleionea sp. HL-JVS1]
MKKLIPLSIAGLMALSLTFPQAYASDNLTNAINGEHRSEAAKQRDQFRHPKETLEFFGFKPSMTVVEISPGGGWYTQILAPALKDSGKLVAAHFDPESSVPYYQKGLAKFKQNFIEKADVYGSIALTVFAPPSKLDIAEPNSADMVLTFRNVHNWYAGSGQEGTEKAFASFFKALKPGGVLGVVEHRLPEAMDQQEQIRSGYMKQSLVIKMAEKAGFKLVEASEINANPKDNAQHPKGVWTLPPSLRLGDTDKEKYMAIGESDRMTLKFVKPATK